MSGDSAKPAKSAPRKPKQYVVHLQVTATDLPRARVLARTAARALTLLAVDALATTVSELDNPEVRHPVFCDRLVGGGRRCGMRIGHELPCAPPAVRRRSI